MRPTVILAALCAVLLASSVDARPRHHHTATTSKMEAVRPIPPGLHRVMAEGAGRVVKPTCADVRAMVAMIGEAKAEAAARSAGATDQQIREARRCLISSAR